MALDYTGIREAIKAVLEAADYSSTFTDANKITKVRVMEEAMIHEMTLSHMPFINVRLADSKAQLRSMPNGYYEYVTYEVDIAAFDFTSLKDASRLRDDILAIARDALQANRNIHGDVSTTHIAGEIKFGAGAVETGGHVGMVTFTVVAEADIDAT